jgi:hypothetical protein
MPTLQSILGIVLESLSPEERRGFEVAEQIYAMQRSPTERAQLYDTMKLIMGECARRNLRYGRAFFGMFKQLERGEWAPVPVPTITLKRTLVTCPDCGFQNDSLAPKEWLASHPCLFRPQKIALSQAERKHA